MEKFHDFEHLGLVFLRVELPDLLRDFYYVAQEVIKIWGDDNRVYQDEDETFHEVLEACVPYKDEQPVCRNRVYVTTEYFSPKLVLADVPEKALQNIITNVTGFKWADDKDARYHLVRDCILVWVFEDERLTHRIPISPTMFGEMLTGLYPDNLINADHLRLNWALTLSPLSSEAER